jgi:hypothetical protein
MTNKQGIPSPFIKEEPWISANNKMSKEDQAKFKAGGQTPIIPMSEKDNLLFIGMQYLSFQTELLDFMAAINYNVDKRTIQMNGRLRFESSGNKTIVSNKPKRYTTANYEKMKNEIRSFIPDVTKEVPMFKAKEPLFELEFAIGEDVNSIINKMNLSNRFNIGSFPKP